MIGMRADPIAIEGEYRLYIKTLNGMQYKAGNRIRSPFNIRIIWQIGGIH